MIRRKIPFAAFAIDILSAHRVLQDRVSNGIGVDAVGREVNVIKRVTGQVVARIVLITLGAAPQRYPLRPSWCPQLR